MKQCMHLALVSAFVFASVAGLESFRPARAGCSVSGRWQICFYGKIFEVRDLTDGEIAISGDCDSGARWASWMSFGMASELYRRVCGVPLSPTR